MRPRALAIAAAAHLCVTAGIGAQQPGAAPALGPGGHVAALHHLRMYYEVRGQGRPLVLLHGGASTIQRSFARQLEDFGRDHLIIAPEQRGHGHTRDVPGPYRYADMAGDTAELLDRLGVRDADVVGWSDGAILALILAVRRPDLVRRLVVSAPNVDPGSRAVTAETLALIRDYRAGHDTAARAEYSRLSGDSIGGYAVVIGKLKRLWLDHPATDELTFADLGRIRAPALVMAGDHDAIRLDQILAIHRAIPGAALFIVPQTGHATFRDRPEWVDPVLRAFLEDDPPR